MYIDDILIYSDSYVDHVKQVRSVLQRLLTHQLYAKIVKCEFHQTSVSFLGYVISSGGVAMEDKKVQAVIDWPQPVTLKELQRFLGFANFYRRFIRNFSTVAAPMTSMLKRGRQRLVWTPAAIAPSRSSRRDSLRLPSCITQIPNENLRWRWMLPVPGLVLFSPNDMEILPNYTLVLFTLANSPPRSRITMWVIGNC